jgi:hypothetical protein
MIQQAVYAVVETSGVALDAHEVGVLAVLGEQLFVAALLGEAAAVED